jgi:diguanylate cyclase (GGDEF)-like protein/PAS domain S-box-containing protein
MKKEQSILKKNILVSVFMTIIILGLYFGYESMSKYTLLNLNIENGIADLSNIESELFSLDGKWRFSGNFSDETAFEDYVEVPGNIKKYNQEMNSGIYELTLKNLKEGYYALKITRVLTSYKLYIDDELVYEQGTSEELKEGKLNTRIIEFQAKNQNTNIKIEHYNYGYYKGGILDSIILGKSNAVHSIYHQRVFKDIFLAGVIGIMAIYHILRYIYRKKEIENLYFGIFAILAFFENLFEGELLFSQYAQNISYYTEERLQTMTILAMLYVFTLYVQKILKLDQRNTNRGIRVVVAVLILFNWITPFTNYYILWRIAELVIVVFIVYIYVLLIRAIIQKDYSAGLIMFGFSWIGFTGVYDLLIDLNVIQPPYLLSIGFVLFLISQMITIFMKYSMAFEEIEDLSESLKNKNLELLSVNEDMEIKIKARTEELEASESRYRHFVDATFEGLIIVDEAEIIDVNEELCRMSGYLREELIGRNILMFFPEKYHSMLIKNIHTFGEQKYIMNLVTKTGREYPIEVLSRAFDYYGKIVKVGAVRDISERILNEKRLEKIRESLKQAQKIAKLGSFEFDIKTNKIYMSDGLRHLLDIGEEELENDDRNIIQIMINRFLPKNEQQIALGNFRRLLEEKCDDSSVFRTKPIYGKARWFRIESRYMKDDLDQHEKIMGVIIDITEQKEREFEIKHNLNFLQVLIDTIPHPIFYKNREGEYIGCNQAFASFFDLTKEEIIGSNVYDLISNEFGKLYKSKDDIILERGGKQVYEGELEDRYGEIHNVIFSKAAYYDLLGQVEGIVGVIVDISDYKKIQEQLKKASITDHLTGLYNRVKFNEVLNDEVKRMRREISNISLIMFDIDRFKQVNDNFGHPVGDEVLIKLANLVKNYVRETDIVARWGGEEFMILVKATDLDGASKLAQKLREEIEKEEFSIVGHITCSFGVAEYRGKGDEKTLLTRVDEALYRAKNNGRNRVELEL